MKRLLLMILVLCSIFGFQGCVSEDEVISASASDYLRIHIRANSNSMDDQNVKYLVKDCIVEYLSPIIAECQDKSEMISAINYNLDSIEDIANSVLEENGFDYVSNAYISEEYFPTRTYGDTTLDADVYDAIIVELGTASGNNWWCVVYPPLCFVNADETSTTGFRYKSKLLEIINNFFD